MGGQRQTERQTQRKKREFKLFARQMIFLKTEMENMMELTIWTGRLVLLIMIHWHQKVRFSGLGCKNQNTSATYHHRKFSFKISLCD